METSLSQAYTDTHIPPHQIIPLDFESVRELPESHIWTPAVEDRHHNEWEELPVPPVIDLGAPDVTELVGNACRRWGMFQMTNHGVPLGLVDDVEAHARRLFELPADRKLKALRLPSGATGYGVARISPFFNKLMWHEGFTIMGGSAVDHAKQLWPHRYEEFCNVMDNYQKKMKSLAYKILLIALKALGVDEEDEEKISSSLLYESNGALQLNSYPSCPNPRQAVGLAPHTDTQLLTILHQNNTNGLQIFQQGIGWIPIPPIPGALVVNLGDLMHILSNACFPAVYHRVVPNDTSHRFTVGYFYGPPTEAVVAPLPKLPSPRFRAVTVKEYIGIKNKHLEKSLSLIGI